MRRSLAFLLIAAMLGAVLPALQAQSHGIRAYYTRYEEARPILEQLAEVLPAELRGAAAKDLPSTWSRWIARRDSEIRARLVQGDEDSLVNFLLFGTSFTRHPRISLSSLAQMEGSLIQVTPGSPSETPDMKVIRLRVDDLVRALATPGANERLLFARQLVERKKLEVKTASGRERVKQYLVNSLNRVLSESATYRTLLESARRLGDPSAEFAERSKLYAARGLSSDTSLLPNFAIEKSLASLKSRGLFAERSIRRVGIVGPGLDFTDKQDGYDFYPQQTIQPFAIIDTLLRLGLATASELKVTTFDLSPRVNDHLRRAGQRARRGLPYTIQLPRGAEDQLTAEAMDYWTRFGDRVGTPVTPVATPEEIGNVKVRAVRIRPAIVSLITPEDVNIVLQRIAPPAGQEFDLIVATNIFVYYEVFEQSLALTNVARMLRPGGFLLSNNALLELPSSGMRSVDYETVVYSSKPNDGDHIVWYQRLNSK